MSTFDVGIRKYVEYNRLQYWLQIKATEKGIDEFTAIGRGKMSKKRFCTSPPEFIHNIYWQFFLIFTIVVNILIIINYVPVDRSQFIHIIVVVHLTCACYWIDFIGMIVEQIIVHKKNLNVPTVSHIQMMIDGVTLIPLALIYVIVTPTPDYNIFWWLRFHTVFRLYRIPLFFSKIRKKGKIHWLIFMGANVFYFALFIDVFANIYLSKVSLDSPIEIDGWNVTYENQLITFLYFSFVICLNVGFGDIKPSNYGEMIACAVGMITGCCIVSGVFAGALASEFTNKDKKREIFRQEYDVTMNILKQRKIDKRALEKTSENLMAFWKYKNGFNQTPPVHLLPLSMQKEMYFDVNFGLLNRSIVFSMQPRSFLRSVALHMRNMSFFPGDIIVEPFGMADMMICVASGVIEIVSEENDETTLLSLTTGTVLGEVNLFLSIPARCIIRASTFVELQVLRKVNFSRLALKYPTIYRTMRWQIINRISIREELELDDAIMESDFTELSRKKATKRLIHDLRRRRKEIEKESAPDLDRSILSLYVISENVPRVKTLAINLIKAKPWILRPNTPLTDSWELLTVLTVGSAAFAIPYMTGFVREISFNAYVFLFIVEIVYVADLLIQCLTAIERKDHFTFETSIRKIIATKLRTIGFYLDVLAAFNLRVYAEFIKPAKPPYGYLLLSLNRVLKVWQIHRFFRKYENKMNRNLLLIVTIKNIIYFALLIFWTATILYLEACPDETCYENRWFGQAETKAIEDKAPTPCTDWPQIMSLYFASVAMSNLGYGDVTPTSIPDCITIIFVIVVGTTFTVVCIAQISAAVKYRARVRTNYQAEVFAVDRFMTEHELSKDLQLKVRNYFQTQWNYDQGYSLHQRTVTENLPSQQRRIIIGELVKTFRTVPLFHDATTDFLRVLAKRCRVRVLPPNEMISNAGSFFREMYILEHGYCEVSKVENGVNVETGVISSMISFGFVEMILGIPLEINVQTLTHVRLIILDYPSYMRAATKYPKMKTNIEELLDKHYTRGISSFDLLVFKPIDDGLDSETVKMQKELLSRTFINVYKYHKSISKNYWKPFQAWGKFRFLQFLFFPFAIVPHSLFIKIWMTIRIICVLIIGIVAPIHYSLPQYTQGLMVFILFLQAFAWTDMYLMFHVAYYDHNGILTFHLAKTVTYYLKGNFLLDIITMFPLHFVINLAFPRKDVTPSIFYDAPPLIMVLQIYKFFQGCYYLENDILRRIERIKVLKFIPLTIIVNNLIAGLMILSECYRYKKGTYPKQLQTLEDHYQANIAVYCSPYNNTGGVRDREASVVKLYVMTYYWVLETMTACGYGDLTAHDGTTMVVCMIVLVFGMMLYTYMFASLTSTMISVHNSVTKYRRRIMEMIRLMKEKNVSNDLQTRLILHYQYNWQRTEGGKPQNMFTYVYAALRENIMASMYEATVRQVPAFVNLEKPVVRIIGKHLNEIYFLRGETIVKYNDIQEYIYMIYRGKVEVRSESGNLITTMDKGGLFGNISNKPFCLSSVNVIAKKDVDIIRLDCQMFFKDLQVFPNTKHLVDYLKSQTLDYIEPLTTDQDDSSNSNSNIDLSEADTIPFEMLLHNRPAPGRKFNFSFHDITEGDYLYLNKSVFKAPFKPCKTFVILPESWLHKTICFLAFGLGYASASVTLYMFAYQDFSTFIMTISYLMDFVFFLRVCFQCNIAYLDKYGDCVVNRKKIKSRYLKSKKIIVLDILANIPFEILSVFFPRSKMLPALSIFRLNRLLRVRHVFDFYEARRKVLMINKIWLELSWIFVCSGLMMHSIACIWYFQACPMGHCQPVSWINRMSLPKNAPKVHLYFGSIYYVISLTTTSGYGDYMVPYIESMLTASLCLILSRFCIALLAGAMAAVINANYVNTYVFKERITELKKNFRQQNMSEYQLGKMWNYMTQLWIQETGKQIPKFINTAPYVMKCEVMYEMFGAHLHQSYAFSDLDEAFLRQLAACLRRFIYFPGNYIIQQGDIDHTMYFIHKGQVSVLTIYPDLMETIHFTLQENDNFGVDQGLIYGTAHHFSYRAETQVEILSLTLSHWQHLLKYFPQVKPQVYKKGITLPRDSVMASTMLLSDT